MIGVKFMFPIVGGHEGSGIVTEVETNVTPVAEGDHIAVAFIPSCGTCFWCASGRQNLCDLGMTTLAGGRQRRHVRYHLGGENLNRMTQLGTFAEQMVVHENSLVRINPWENMKAAALISCGLATGFGSAVDRAKVKPGETVVVAGCGGVGSGAIQGARLAGARHIIAVDPIPFELGAPGKSVRPTPPPRSSTRRWCCPSSRWAATPTWSSSRGMLKGEMIAEASACGSKSAGIVVTAIAPFSQMDVKLNLFNLAMFNQSVLGTVFGSQYPRVQVPNMLNLYTAGQLQIDELITQEYTLDQVQQGYEDQAAGTIIHGRGEVRHLRPAGWYIGRCAAVGGCDGCAASLSKL